MTDKEVLDVFYRSDGKINPNMLRKNMYVERLLPGVTEYIKNRYKDIPENMFSVREVLWRMRYNIETRPVCPICGNPVVFHGKPSHNHIHTFSVPGYVTHCSIKCGRKDIRIEEKRKEANIKKYGVDNPFKSKDLMTKAWEKYKMNTGYDCPSQNPEVREKIKSTYIQHYGVEHPRQNKDFILKVRRNNIKKYGNPHGRVSLVSEEEKRRRIKKQQETYRKNHSYKKSKPEDLLRRMFYETFGKEDVICQFSSEEYPFKCDFYIRSLDLYIEYQGGCFHNNRPYDKITDKESLDWLSSKKSKTDKPNRYDYIILEWTVLDVKKRNRAKEKGINYLEIFPYWEVGWMSFCNEFEGRKHSQYYVNRYDEFRVKLYDLISQEFRGVNNKQMIIGMKDKSWYEK